MKIRFLENYKVKAVDGEEYTKDKVYDLNEKSCFHFVNKNVAEFVEGFPVSQEKTTAKVTK